jgi:hypothetical protein
MIRMSLDVLYGYAEPASQRRPRGVDGARSAIDIGKWRSKYAGLAGTGRHQFVFDAVMHHLANRPALMGPKRRQDKQTEITAWGGSPAASDVRGKAPILGAREQTWVQVLRDGTLPADPLAIATARPNARQKGG